MSFGVGKGGMCVWCGVGRELMAGSGRELLGCRAVAISRAKAYSEEKTTVAEAISEAFASTESCEDATARAEVNMKVNCLVCLAAGAVVERTKKFVTT